MGFVGRPGAAHGRRRVPRLPALDEDAGDRPDALHDPDRLLQERRLVVGDGDRSPRTGTFTRRSTSRPARRTACTTARSWRRTARDSMVVPVAVDGRGDGARRTRAATSRGALTFGNTTWPPRRRERPEQPALQQRLGLRRQRLDVAAGVGRLAVLLLRRAERAAGRDAVPGRHDVGRRGAVHRPRHADLRAVGERFSCSTLAPFGAPYILDTVGGSQNTYIGSGTWRFDTATGGSRGHRRRRRRRRACTRSSSTASASRATSSRAVHDHGRQRDRVAVARSSSRRRPDTGAFDVTFKSSVDLPGCRPTPSGSASRRTITRPAPPGQPERPEHGERQGEPHAHARVARDVRRSTSAANDVDLFVALRREQRRHFTQQRDRRLVDRRRRHGRGGRPRRAAGRQLPDLGARLRRSRSAGDFTLGEDIVQGNDLTVTGVPGGRGPGEHAGDAARRRTPRPMTPGRLQGRAAARPVDRADGDQRAGDDHAQLIDGRSNEQAKGAPPGGPSYCS